MSEINTGGPAFPTENAHQSGHATFHFEGMTLRDWFAGKALAGIGTWIPAETYTVPYGLKTDAAVTARAIWAYAQADAMIAAREGGAL